MSLYEFSARNQKAAIRASRLSQRLLEAISQVEQAVAHEAADPHELGASTFNSAAQLGLYGSGLARLDGGSVPFVAVDERMASPELRRIESTDAVEQLSTLLQPRELGGVYVWGIPPAELQWSEGGRVLCGGRRGRLGCWAATPGRPLSITTAGHVAGSSGTLATAGEGPEGVVVFAQHLSTVPAFSRCADIALISTVGIRPLSSSISTIASPTGADKVAIVGGDSPEAAVLAMCDWFAVPHQPGLWGNVYLTNVPISERGDSGAAVVAVEGQRLVGHIVGGSPGSTSVVQDANYQLAVAGSQLAVN